MSKLADLILFNGKIITVNENFEVMESVAIKDGKFLAVGTNNEVKAFADENTELIDLKGKTVVPGLIDTHIHVEMCAKQVGWVNLEKAREIKDVLELISDRVQKTPIGETIMVWGPWHEKQLKEGRMLTRWDIDQVSPHHPVVILRGGHVAMCNSKALEISGITKDTPNPEHGIIVRDKDTGEATGVLIEDGKKLIENLIPNVSEEDMIENIHSFMAEQNAYGVTGMTDPLITQKDIEIYKKVVKFGNPTARISGLHFVNSLEETKDVFSTYKHLEGDDFFRITGIKSFADGGVEGAWLKDPYQIVKGQQEDPNFRGVPYFGGEREVELRKMLKLTAKEGWQIQIHVAGDAATEQIVNLYEEVSNEYPIDAYRWTAMHVLDANAKDLERMKDIGCSVTVQNLSYLLGKNMVAYWGQEKASNAAAIRSMIDLGIPIGGGTDSPVVPWNPFISMHWMVTRKLVDGTVLGIHEGITREEAIKIWTIGSAYNQFNENNLGSIEPGKFADLAVLSDDILSISEEEIKNLYSELTMVNGKIVYRKNDSLVSVEHA